MVAAGNLCNVLRFATGLFPTDFYILPRGFAEANEGTVRRFMMLLRRFAVMHFGGLSGQMIRAPIKILSGLCKRLIFCFLGVLYWDSGDSCFSEAK